MNKTKKWFKAINSRYRRAVQCICAAFLLLASVSPLLIVANASAFSTLQSKSLNMSCSVPGSVTSGEGCVGVGVTYTIKFTTVNQISLTNPDSIVINFCSTDASIGHNCSSTVGSPAASGSVPDITSSSGFGISYTGCLSNCSWNASTAFPSPVPTISTGCSSTGYSNSTLYLTNVGTLIPAGTTITITIPNVTNPTSANTPFYAQISTYNDNVQTNSTANNNLCPDGGSNLSSIVDGGGVAASTAGQISIAARVGERLTFCLYTLGSCVNGGSNVTLGDSGGVLSTSQVYVDNSTEYDVQTNASSDVNIQLTGNTLNSGSKVIQASSCSGVSTAGCPGGASNTASSVVASDQYGLCTWEVSGSTITPASTYNGGGNCNVTQQTAGPSGSGAAFGDCNSNRTVCSTFGLNLNAGGSGINSPNGDVIAVVTPGDTATGDIAFMANVSRIAPAGIYQSSLTFIATGTF